MHSPWSCKLGRPEVFFFSSRRRHTRYWRDWSSDVCSSDLAATDFGDARHRLAVQFATISAEITGGLIGTFLLAGPEQSKVRRVPRHLILRLTARGPVIDHALWESSELRPQATALAAAPVGP